MDHPEAHDSYAAEPAAPFSISHLLRTIRSYAGMIIISLIAVMIAYAIVALVLYLRAPSRRVTSLPFRLQFSGAVNGNYPNGLTFSPADITDTGVLLGVYKTNHLEHFMPYETFSNSIFVSAANAQ